MAAPGLIPWMAGGSTIAGGSHENFVSV